VSAPALQQPEFPLAAAIASRAAFDKAGAHGGCRRLVGPDVNFGRELLLAAARRRGSVAGCEAVNLRQIADGLAFTRLAAQGVRVADDVQLADLVERAVAAVARKRQGTDTLASSLVASPGFLRAFRDSILETRMAGVSSGELRRAARAGSAAANLVAVLREYEQLLGDERLADPAQVFTVALEAFDEEAPFVLAGETLLVEGLTLRGLPGRLVTHLQDRGARVLARAAPLGADAPRQLLAATARDSEWQGTTAAPSILAAATGRAVPSRDSIDDTVVACDVFAAATPMDELREVCRRVLAEGLRWDDVEIVATDPDEYGVALDALAQQIGMGATMLRGIPLARTRLGRATERWFSWLENELPADVLREAIEAGDVALPKSELAGATLSRELRGLSIGWGRTRYEAAVDGLRDGRTIDAMRPDEEESDEDFQRRRAARQAACGELLRLLERLLDVAPAVPARGSDASVTASASGLARATLGFLELVPTHAAAEEQTKQRLMVRLEQLARLATPDTAFASALGTVRALVADVRAWPVQTADRKPWSSNGGMIHLTDLAHAGLTCRGRTFVVGMDADRTVGPIREDPLLDDATRRALAVDGLPTTTERREEWEHHMAVALAGLRGRVTLSYAMSATLDGREASPSPILLAVQRLTAHNPTFSYGDLRTALFPPASAVPGGPAEGHIDARDVWLGALADGPLLLDGSAAVARAFPMLAAGLRAADEAAAPQLGPFHGFVPEAGPLLDPTTEPLRLISASALEAQAACALRWFYKYGLGISAPDDPQYDPDRWLDPLQRGALLHEVFEAFTRVYKGRQNALDDPAARERVLELTDASIARWWVAAPPPSEAVFAAESDEIRRAALAFLAMERDRWATGDRGEWSEFELEFGWVNPAGVYPLDDGTSLGVRGRVDRVDLMPDGTLRVVDYKTGSARGYGNNPKAGPFNGGRRLQPALYVPAIAAALRRAVSRFEYRFPTERGQNEIVAYGEASLEPAKAIISELVAQTRAGAFVPTNDAADCAYCDYMTICRVARSGRNVISPRAAWAKEFGPAHAEYASVIGRRGQSVSPAAEGDE